MLIEKQSVFLSDDPVQIRECLNKNVPCIYLERRGSAPVYECPYVWQITEEDTIPDESYLTKVFRRHYHLPLTICESQRLLIRESVKEDLEELLVFYKEEAENPDIQQLGEKPKDQFQKYIEHQYQFWEFGLWTILKKDTGEIIGRVGLEAFQETVELEYLIGKSHRGNGYAKEACEAILSYAGSELGFDTILLRTSEQNICSRQLALSLGFEHIDYPEITEMLYRKMLDKY